MKALTKWTLKMALLITLLVGSSCTINESGPVGPPGPIGDPGNANVETIYFSFSYASQDIRGEYSEAAIYMPEIDQAVLDNGVVLAYHEKSPEFFQALPYTESYPSGYHYGFNFAYQMEEAVFIFESDDEEWQPGANQEFAGKIIIIYGPYAFNKLSGVDVKDYNAVKKALKLTD